MPCEYARAARPPCDEPQKANGGGDARRESGHVCYRDRRAYGRACGRAHGHDHTDVFLS